MKGLIRTYGSAATLLTIVASTAGCGPTLVNHTYYANTRYSPLPIVTPIQTIQVVDFDGVRPLFEKYDLLARVILSENLSDDRFAVIERLIEEGKETARSLGGETIAYASTVTQARPRDLGAKRVVLQVEEMIVWVLRRKRSEIQSFVEAK